MSSERVLESIISEINKIIPKNAGVTSIEFEGPEVAIYSKNLSVLLDEGGLVSNIARTIRKRVVIRSDPSIRLDHDEVRKIIHEELDDKVTIGDIEFDESIGEVLIHVNEPNRILKRDSNTIKDLTIKTKWRPHIYRIPPIMSNVVKSVRNVLFTDAVERKMALRKIGKLVHREGILEEPIVRITALGGYLEVGRTATLLQTGDANVLIDCGVSVGTSQASKMLPRFDLPEFEILNLDAVIVSHAHLDHCLPGDTPVLMANGQWEYIRDISENDEVLTMNWITGKNEIGKVERKTITTGHDTIRNIQTTYGNIGASPNHRFFVVKNLNIVEIEASELKLNMLIPFVRSIPKSSKSIEVILKTDIDFGGRIRINNNFRLLIKNLRINAKYSQKQLADKVGVQANTISKLENKGKNVYLNTINLILSEFKLLYQNLALKYELLRLPEKLTPQLAQLVGYIQGDGHRSGEYTIRITEMDTSVISEYQNIICDTFGFNPIIRERKETKSTTYYIEINNKWIVDFLKYNFNTVLGLSREIQVPYNIENSSHEVISGYLRGLYDAEGSALPSIKFTSYSLTLIQRVQNLLLRLNIYGAYSEKDKSITINSIQDKKGFQAKIGFSSKIKSVKLKTNIDGLEKTNYQGRKLIPITTEDFREMLHKIGYIGRAHDGPKIDEMPLSLLDFYRRKKGYITTETATILIEFLQERYSSLLMIKQQNEIIELRKSLSITRNKLSNISGLTYMQVQYREEGYRDEKSIILKKFLLSMISETLSNIEFFITQIEHLLSIDVSWQRIKKITDLDNFEPLYDISVSPNPNFVANSMVVHNCGFVPFLYKYGYEGPIYTTEPTLHLMTMLQIDYLDIAEKEGKLLPYSKSDIRKSTIHTIPTRYGEVTDIAPGVKLTFHNGGHILGSSIVHLHIGNGKYNLAFAHDFKFANTRLLDRAVFKFPRLETLVMEATYGNPQDVTPSRKQSEADLAKIINETLARGGKVLIPVLAVGRAQELQLVIEHLMRTKKIPEVPVYVDGMIKEATAITANHPEFLSRQLRDRILNNEDNPFLAPCFSKISSIEERNEVLMGASSIIMATSGMLVGGPSVFYFNNLAEDDKNSIIFVSYQGRGTLGRKIDEGSRSITMKNDSNKTIELEIKLHVYRLSGFTGHSDRNELMEYAKRVSPRPKQYLLVHGEASKCVTLAKAISKMVKRDASAPPIGSTTRLY